mgnify:CR=1 FL=1
MSTDIVVGIDGSANATKALQWALDEAEVRGVRVRAVLTWSYMGEGDSILGVGTTEDDAREALDAAIKAGAGDRASLVDPVPVNDLAVDGLLLSLIHISEPTRPLYISYAVFCLKK